jgi:DNA uptake protein ComE-like DNA-binding protein
MKGSRGKEGDHPHSSHEPQRTGSPDNILAVLVIATLLLGVSAFSSIHESFLQRKEAASMEKIPDTYVWISGSHELSEGLYLFTPKQLEDKIPGFAYLAAEAPTVSMPGQTVFAIHYIGDSPGAVKLPPEVANIFFRPISLNRADKNILCTLPGIGPVLAERIVQRRKEKGPYRSMDELMQVPGIGPGKLAHLAEYIFLD